MSGHETCHCGRALHYGYDGNPDHTRGMCADCDASRCDADPTDCPYWREVAAQDDSGGRVDADLVALRVAAEAAQAGGDWDRAVAKMGRLTRNGRAAAAGNPEAVLALIARVEAAEAAASAPGVCPNCDAEVRCSLCGHEFRADQ